MRSHAACSDEKSGIAAGLAAKLRGVHERLERGKKEDAFKELRSIDLRYGGLAAPDSVELLERINALP